MKPKPKVGQILYSLNVGNAARNTEQKLTRVVVTKVGRKYFTCGKKEDAYHQVQYYIDGWYEKSDYIADSCLYESPQEWEDEKEESRLCKTISSAFDLRDNRRDVSLPNLRRIADIIEGRK